MDHYSPKFKEKREHEKQNEIFGLLVLGSVIVLVFVLSGNSV